MSKLHLRFRNIRPDVLDAARQLFDRNPHQLEADEQQVVAAEFIAKVCAAYEVPTPEVRVEPRTSRWQGTYEYLPAEALVSESGSPESLRAAQVILRKFSVLNIFGIVRTHLLNHQAVTPKADEPWGWACSLFYAVKPVRFRKLVRDGKIRKGLVPADTYTRATFARMVAAGVAEEDGNVLVRNFDPRLLDQIEEGTLDIRTILPQSAQPSALSSWSWDDDEEDDIDILAEDDDENAPAPSSEPAPFDEDESGDDDEPVALDAEAQAEQASGDGLDDLGIVQLRGLSRGRVPGAYSLSKVDLLTALRAQGIDSTGAVRR